MRARDQEPAHHGRRGIRGQQIVRQLAAGRAEQHDDHREPEHEEERPSSDVRIEPRPRARHVCRRGEECRRPRQHVGGPHIEVVEEPPSGDIGGGDAARNLALERDVEECRPVDAHHVGIPGHGDSQRDRHAERQLEAPEAIPVARGEQEAQPDDHRDHRDGPLRRGGEAHGCPRHQNREARPGPAAGQQESLQRKQLEEHRGHVGQALPRIGHEAEQCGQGECAGPGRDLVEEAQADQEREHDAAGGGECGRKACRELGRAQRGEERQLKPVKEDGLLEARVAVEARRQVVAVQQHLAGRFGEAGFVRFPERGAAESREQRENADGRCDGHHPRAGLMPRSAR